MTNVRSPGAFLPDSHSIVWDFLRDPQLSERARDIFRLAERGGATLVIPTIVLAEVHRISERRIRNVSTDAVLRWVAGIPSLDVAPFDFDVFTEMRRQPIELSLHDRIIAATARVYGPTLISRDRQLSSVVETIW